jgi:hypothetical protein
MQKTTLLLIFLHAVTVLFSQNYEKEGFTFYTNRLYDERTEKFSTVYHVYNISVPDKILVQTILDDPENVESQVYKLKTFKLTKESAQKWNIDVVFVSHSGREYHARIMSDEESVRLYTGVTFFFGVVSPITPYMK